MTMRATDVVVPYSVTHGRLRAGCTGVAPASCAPFSCHFPMARLGTEAAFRSALLLERTHASPLARALTGVVEEPRGVCMLALVGAGIPVRIFMAASSILSCARPGWHGASPHTCSVLSSSVLKRLTVPSRGAFHGILPRWPLRHLRRCPLSLNPLLSETRAGCLPFRAGYCTHALPTPSLPTPARRGAACAAALPLPATLWCGERCRRSPYGQSGVRTSGGSGATLHFLLRSAAFAGAAKISGRGCWVDGAGWRRGGGQDDCACGTSRCAVCRSVSRAGMLFLAGNAAYNPTDACLGTCALASRHTLLALQIAGIAGDIIMARAYFYRRFELWVAGRGDWRRARCCGRKRRKTGRTRLDLPVASRASGIRMRADVPRRTEDV